MLLHGGEVESQIEETTVLVESVEDRSQREEEEPSSNSATSSSGHVVEVH